uniref:Granulins domain-containing protein n=1 Tax=Kryptolebias marmoratus TaxID=37003 RepID=A0A3Q3B3Y5_KRYMA
RTETVGWVSGSKSLCLGTCDDRASSSPLLPWFSKVPAQSSENCDQQTACPGGTTCCRREAGLWGCCPLPQAVCCSDREHCCPRGYRCNVAQQTCDRPGDTSGEPVGVRIPCDARTSCPKDTTCCFMEKSHRWGCCPVPDVSGTGRLQGSPPPERFSKN